MVVGVDDEGILDHTMAKLLPGVTSLRAKVEPRKEPSLRTTEFTPAEKIEKQLRFHRVRTAGRLKTPFPMR